MLTDDEVNQLHTDGVGGELSYAAGFTPGSSLAQDLVAYWPLDGDVQDASGGSNHCTKHGSTAFSASKSKVGGQAAVFSNDDSFIVCEPLSGGPTGNAAVSIAIWAYPESCGNRGLISYGGNGARARQTFVE